MPNRGTAPISQQTPMTIGLVILVLGVSFGAIFKAGQVLSELDYVKAAVSEIRSELRDIKYLVRQSDPGKRSYNENNDLGHGPYSTAESKQGSFQ